MSEIQWLHPFDNPFYIWVPQLVGYAVVWFFFGSFLAGMYNNHIGKDEYGARFARMDSEGLVFWASVLWPLTTLIICCAATCYIIADVSVVFFPPFGRLIAGYWHWAVGDAKRAQEKAASLAAKTE